MKNQVPRSLMAGLAGFRTAPMAASDRPQALEWVEGAHASYLITAQDTRGQAALLEALLMKGQEPPAHFSADSDETFYIMAGRVTFYIGRDVVSATEGQSVFIPRGKEHRFRVDTPTANVLILLTLA